MTHPILSPSSNLIGQSTEIESSVLGPESVLKGKDVPSPAMIKKLLAKLRKYKMALHNTKNPINQPIENDFGEKRFGLPRTTTVPTKTTAKPDQFNSLFLQKLIENIQSHSQRSEGLGSGHMGSFPSANLVPKSTETNFGDLLEIRKKFAPLAFDPEATRKPVAKIPDHLIPLGPDGKPLLNPDGSPATHLRLDGPSHLGMGSSYELGETVGQIVEVTSVETTTEVTEAPSGGFLSNIMNSVRNMPFETRRQMFARYGKFWHPKDYVKSITVEFK